MKIFHKITGRMILEIKGETLVGANLRRADLREADLQRANLRGANLPPNLIILYGSQHVIIAIDADIRIGCHFKPLAFWLKHYDEIGTKENYTPVEIAEYGLHLRHIQALIELRNGKK